MTATQPDASATGDIGLRRIVVPLDGSDLALSALGPAVPLAGITGATIQLLTTDWHPRGGMYAYLEAQAERHHLDRVELVVDPARDAPAAILHAASRPEATVCMATHGHHGVRAALMGSVANAVVQHAEHPLLLVGPSSHTRFSGFEPPNMLIAVDGSPAAEAMVPFAIAWSRRLDLRPWLANVVTPRDGAHSSDVRDDGYLRGLAGRTGCATLEWDVLHGQDVAQTLIDYAAHLPATLMVLATSGIDSLGDRAFGTVTERTIRHSPCPVLVMPAAAWEERG